MQIMNMSTLCRSGLEVASRCMIVIARSSLRLPPLVRNRCSDVDLSQTKYRDHTQLRHGVTPARVCECGVVCSGLGPEERMGIENETTVYTPDGVPLRVDDVRALWYLMVGYIQSAEGSARRQELVRHIRSIGWKAFFSQKEVGVCPGVGILLGRSWRPFRSVPQE